MSSYEIIFKCLLDAGYTEKEAEQLLCNVIEDQISYTDYADRLHKIFVKLGDKRFS